jgi:hypothetical protein
MAINVPKDSESIASQGGSVRPAWYRFFTELLRLVNGKATLAEVGAMVSGNTETNITVTFESDDNTLDFVVPAMSDTAAGVVEAAVQSEMEAGTSTTLAVTPGRQHFHPSAAKGWVRAGVSGNILASYNVGAVTDTGTGQATISWDTDLSADGSTQATIQGGAPRIATIGSIAAGAVRIDCYNIAGALVDPTEYHVAVFGDL